MSDDVERFSSLENLANEIRNKLDVATEKKKILALYAFNATGKTRLSNVLSESDDEDDVLKVLCYNALLEDVFTWDNEKFILKFDPRYWIAVLVKEQGLELQINKNFQDIVNSRVEPLFDFEKGEISFSIASGDDASKSNIKVSRSEESMLIWSIFFTVLEVAVEALDTPEGDRTTKKFDELRRIIVDDPVSSIDDTKIVAMAVKFINLVKSAKNSRLKYFITTHHALFYNLLVNSLDSAPKISFKSYNLAQDNNQFELKEQGDSPFSYHVAISANIQKAVNDNSIERDHFNLFRSLLEKTSVFFGYSNWADCIPSHVRKDEFRKLLNVYSHNRLSEIESRGIPISDRVLFEEVFSAFIDKFGWKRFI